MVAVCLWGGGGGADTDASLFFLNELVSPVFVYILSVYLSHSTKRRGENKNKNGNKKRVRLKNARLLYLFFSVFFRFFLSSDGRGKNKA